MVTRKSLKQKIGNIKLRYVFTIILVITILAFQLLPFQVVLENDATLNKENSLLAMKVNAPTISNLRLPDMAPWDRNIKPVTGPQSVIVILVEFDDVKHKRNRDEIGNMFSSKLNNYITEISYNKAWVVANVTYWISLPNDMEYYGRDSESNIDLNIFKLFEDSISLCDESVDFNEYEHIIIVHAGYGQETSEVTTDLWSCYCVFTKSILVDGKLVGKAAIVPEAETNGLDTLGVYAHEFLHSLGLPDLYDINNSTKESLGTWDIMDKGVINGEPPGSCPPHPISWAKIKLGWIESYEEVLAGNFRNVTLNPLESKDSNYSKVLKIPISNNIYYLIEFRKKTGYDRELPDEGLIIIYVDENKLPNNGGVILIDAVENTTSLEDVAFKSNSFYEESKQRFSLSFISITNNMSIIEVDRRIPKPDLFIKRIDIHYRLQATNVTSITVEVANSGKVEAQGFNVNFYLDGMNFYWTRLSLDPKTSRVIEINDPIQSGEHTLLVRLDPRNLIKEYNEKNNHKLENFTIGYSIEIYTAHEGIPVSIDGSEKLTDINGSVEFHILAGTHNISVPKAIELYEGAQLGFVEWEGLSSNNSFLFDITQDSSINLDFVKQFYLDVDAGRGAVEGDGWHNENAIANISAVSPYEIVKNKSRLVFTHWSGDLNDSSSNLIILMNGSYSLVANWRVQYYLKIDSSYEGVMGEGWYDPGTNVTPYVIRSIIEEENVKRVFQGWEGDYSGPSHNFTISMDKEKYVNVIWEEFHKISFTTEGLPENNSIALVVNGTLHEIKIPNNVNEWYRDGTIIAFDIVTASVRINDLNYVFCRWEDSNGTELGSPKVINKGEIIKAIFIPQEFGSNISFSRLGSFKMPSNFKAPDFIGMFSSPLILVICFLVLAIIVVVIFISIYTIKIKLSLPFKTKYRFQRMNE